MPAGRQTIAGVDNISSDVNEAKTLEAEAEAEAGDFGLEAEAGHFGLEAGLEAEAGFEAEAESQKNIIYVPLLDVT